MSQAHGLSDTLARVLAGRDVGAHQAPGFLDPKLRDVLPDPVCLTDMAAAATRLADAIQRGETVAIFGDYDVDGACSAALLADFLKVSGTPFVVRIPDRVIEGYGPTTAAVQELKAAGAGLLVLVDCGTSSHAPVSEARRLGLDVIVLDHHGAPVALPEALAIVNPNRQDDVSGLGSLCAAGVVFLALIAVNRVLRARGWWSAHRPEPTLLSALDLVALATVADVVPLTGLNRVFVRQGLVVMRRRQRPGLTALFDVAGLKEPPEAWHLGFMVGPRINAGGRIGDAALGATLLLTADDLQANRIAADLDRLNRERQVVEQAAVAEAELQALPHIAQDNMVLVLGSSAWHPGVVGLVASRLKERFRRPVFAFALDASGGGVGSGRSIAGVDLGQAVRQLVDAGLVRKGGGHAMAAGVTLLSEVGLTGFKESVTPLLAASVLAARETSGALMIDAVLTAAGATPALLADLEQAGPFGSGHPEPVFAFPRHTVVDARTIGNGHVRVRLKSGDGATIEGVAFRASETPLGQELLGARGRLVHVAGSLTLNRWGGQERVQLRIIDAAYPPC